MKLNWGTGIAAFYILFVSVMVGFVFYSKTLDNSLVVDNYYEEDLRYQSHLDKMANAALLKNDLVIEEHESGEPVVLRFPEGFREIGGQVVFYRADRKASDFTVKIKGLQGRSLSVPADRLTPGKWLVKVDWTGDGTAFYKEQTIYL